EDLQGVGDYELVACLLRSGLRVESVARALYFYRWHQDSMSVSRRGHMDRAASIVRRRHWDLAPPNFTTAQIRKSRAGQNRRLPSAQSLQLALGCARHRPPAQALKIGLATAACNPVGIFEFGIKRSGTSA